jgi:hypothetical protein
MAYYDTINLVSGDDKPELNFTLRDSNVAATGATLDPDDATTWAPIDLTGATVNVYFRALGADTTPATLQCGISDPRTAGKCFMTWGPKTLDVEAGTYEAEIEISDAGGKQTVFDKLKFKVRADF